MNNLTTSLKPFPIWAKETHNQNPEIINHWLNGTDLYKKAMAATILEAAAVAQH
jgi:hypothetical protein